MQGKHCVYRTVFVLSAVEQKKIKEILILAEMSKEEPANGKRRNL